MDFIPRASEQLDGVQQRIRALEDMLSSTREALRQGREALTYRDSELKKVREMREVTVVREVRGMKEAAELREKECVDEWVRWW